jgi:hypothetical protein
VKLATAIRTPIIAEGRFSTPVDARRAIELGAFAVVIGSMITRPRRITQKYADSLRGFRGKQYIIGIDIGCTKIAGGIIAPGGKANYHEQIPTPFFTQNVLALYRALSL